jgi:hypothetical protein
MIDTIVHKLAVKRLAQLRALAHDPVASQQAVFNSLIARAYNTSFGRDHGFDRIRNHDEWVRAVPLRDYAAIAPYFDRARNGEADVIWPGHIRYWAISSGTTAGEKYLPVSMDTVRGNKQGGFDAIAPCVATTNPGLFKGRLLFLGGSINLRKHGNNWIGDNTGIMTLHIPRLLRRWHTPGQDVAGLPSWEEKITRAAEISSKQDVRMISGVPSWMIIFGEKVLALTGKKTLREVWPNLALFVHGGMSFGPYRQRMLQLAGGPSTGSGQALWCTDTYSASEGGMLAVQDERDNPGMLPLVDQGVFFEFVPVSELHAARPTRLPLERVTTGVDYAVVLNTDSGIFGYLVGDSVRFTSTQPYRLVFAGRLKHTLNAFGEHVSGGELDRAIAVAAATTRSEVEEFAVATRYPDALQPVGGHVYFVEFRREPESIDEFARAIDEVIISGNEDYTAHRSGGYGMTAPVVQPVARGFFYEWMKCRGRLGGQNKVPRVLTPELHADFVTFAAAGKPS